MNDISVLSSAAIAWSVIGLAMMRGLWEEVRMLGVWWKTFIFLSLGPAAWGLLTYQAIVSWRIAVLIRLHLPDCGCGQH
jgi:hypothetical protein